MNHPRFRLLAPPEFADERQTQAARTFHSVAIGTAAVVAGIIPLVMAVQPTAFSRGLLVMAVASLMVPAALALNRSGRTRLASVLYLVVVLTLLTALALTQGGIRSPGVQAYFVFVMLAGLLLGERLGVGVAIVVAILGLGLVLAEAYGVLPRQQVFYSAPALWLLNCLYICVALLTMRLATRTVRDALRRAEQELSERRSAERRLSQALDAGAIGIYEHDLQTGVFRGDDRTLALAGLTARADGTVPYAEWEGLVHPDDRQRLASELGDFAASHHRRTSYRIRRPDGVERHLEAAAYVTGSTDAGSASIVGMITDVSDRKDAERERERLLVDLKERVKELRLLHTAAQLLQTDRAVDRELLTELVVIMPAAWLYPDDCRARIVYEDIDVCSPGWRTSPWRQSASFTTSTGRGLVEVVYLSEHPVRDEGPFVAEERALIHSIAQMLRSHVEEDIAERQRRALEVQLRQSQKMQALGTLAGGIAHDFNNILTAIGGNAELALAEIPKDSSVRESLDEILKGYARARDLVRRILLFSRRQDAVRSVIVLPPLVEEALNLLRVSLPTTVQTETNVAADLPAVFADPSQIHQIVMNLGTNAIYAMGDRGGMLSVDLAEVVITDAAAAPSADLGLGRYVRIGVRDTGTGMSEAVRERLFEPFFTTKGHEGTGLGLSVVHGIVHDHGGAIAVESELGVGTLFNVYLPVASAHRQLPASDLTGIVRGSGQHVMYVDDEESLVALMPRTLERLGYRCTAFTSPHAALQEFRTHSRRFAAVVTDMQMPAMSGLELAQALRAIRPDVPIAIASGYTLEEGGSDHTVRWIRKPTTLVTLSRALGEMLTPSSAVATRQPSIL